MTTTTTTRLKDTAKMGPGDPPDRQKAAGATLLSPNQAKTLSTPGSKFIIISRDNPNDKHFNLSPFAIKKIIDFNCDGPVLSCKKLRSGDLLVNTKTVHQANKLLKMTHFTSTMPVIVSTHSSLNYTRGVIYSNDLRNIPEEEILQELKDQHVTEVKKILKKFDGTLKETGLIILTFDSTTLPTHLMIGYERTSIRQYIPTPLRCHNCFGFGHTYKICKNPKACYKCGSTHHTLGEETCLKNVGCINCIKNNLSPYDHCSIDRNCPLYKKNQEIIAIKITHQIDNKAAYEIYNKRHNPVSYADKTKIQSPTTTLTAPIPTPSSTPTRITRSYDDLDPKPSTSLASKLGQNLKQHKTKVQILPKTTSKRTLRQIKGNTKNVKSTNSKHSDEEDDSSDIMEFQ